MKDIIFIVFLIIGASGCSVTASPGNYSGVVVKEFDINAKKVLHVSGTPQASAVAITDVDLKKGNGDARLYVYLNAVFILPSKKRSGVLDCSFYVDDDVNLIYFGDSDLVIWERH